ncbi:hypothetical protein SLEP1_g7233 [Rubroshorea leprosula]|uniref:KIB1-4 beta-propeller domain-containing protein n=1 Tax=Rubroshorea leprosula TaxID=152421 RepID=A0AAV5I400_9ROSI|nr:hypothetical protein SLEP1_g7233 [Rubroshorea leprosula]
MERMVLERKKRFEKITEDILESILKRLPLIEILRAKAVWFEEQPTVIYSWPSSTLGRHLHIGSSHGWLIVADGRSVVYLLNPFTLATIQFPQLDRSFWVEPDDYLRRNDYWDTNDIPPQDLMGKAILTGEPNPSGNNNYSLVILIYNIHGQLIQGRKEIFGAASVLLADNFALLDAFSQSLVLHTSREGNSAADFMASLDHNVVTGTSIFPEPPAPGSHRLYPDFGINF